MKCADCRFFEPEFVAYTIAAGTAEEWRREPSEGKCRRRAPDCGTYYKWATVSMKDWCGEFESKDVNRDFEGRGSSDDAN